MVEDLAVRLFFERKKISYFWNVPRMHPRANVAELQIRHVLGDAM